MLVSCAMSVPALAQAQTPEIRREPFPPQAPGTIHTIRIIPETCAYLRGEFVAQIPPSGLPYRYGAARSAQRCQPRARLVDPAKAMPSAERGWILNDLIRIPNAACPGQVAVIRVWRKPADTAPLASDAQGGKRIYLQDAKRQAAEGRIAPLPQYAAVLAIEGGGCSAAAP